MTDRKAKRIRAYRRGHRGEWLASLALMLKGFRIVARRYRTKLGEIDLIARRGDLVLIVEVKVRADADRGDGGDQRASPSAASRRPRICGCRGSPTTAGCRSASTWWRCCRAAGRCMSRMYFAAATEQEQCEFGGRTFRWNQCCRSTPDEVRDLPPLAPLRGERIFMILAKPSHRTSKRGRHPREGVLERVLTSRQRSAAASSVAQHGRWH